MRKRFFVLLMAFATLVGSHFSPRLEANSEIRPWSLADGTGFHAEIVSVDEPNERLVLRDRKGNERTLAFGDISLLDRAWVLEWSEMNEELMAKAEALGTKFQSFDGKGARYATEFYVFHPSGEPDPKSPRPMMILFDPAGMPVRYLLRHVEAAEAVNMTVVACDRIRNGSDGDEARERLRELYPIIAATVPHDPKRVYFGGTSGGALRAFILAAELPEIKIAGIYSNVGWLGGGPYDDLPFPACRVAVVNGDEDKAADQSFIRDTPILQRRGCTIALFAFEGGHKLPPVTVQVKAFQWLLGDLE